VPDQCAITGTWLGKGVDPSAAPLLLVVSGRNQPRGARSCFANQPATKVSDFFGDIGDRCSPAAPIDSKNSIKRTRIDNRDPLGAIAHMFLTISGALARM
jgi:hypothetical protein